MDKIYDCIIVGAGPAGLSCALYLLRANKNILVVDKKEPMSKVKKLTKIDNYLGFNDKTGIELSNEMISHVSNIKSDCIRIFNVQKIFKNEDVFYITDNEEMLSAKNVVLATGLEEKEIIKDSHKFLGKGLSYCISCDGFLYKNKTVCLIGSEDKLNIMKNQFKSITDKIISFSIDDVKNAKILGNEVISSIIVNDIKYDIDGIFIDPIYSNLSLDLSINKKGQFIITDQNCMTNINGLYAVGDVANHPIKQIISAANDGAIAASNIIKNL